MSVSAEAPPTPDPNGPLPSSASGESDGRKGRPQAGRPLVVTGGIAACAAAASGLAVLITLTAIGWITAPHVGIGTGLGGVLRTAAMLWLVAHHVGFTVRGAGRIGLLPLGLVLLPGALLAVAGRWVVRAAASPGCATSACRDRAGAAVRAALRPRWRWPAGPPSRRPRCCRR